MTATRIGRLATLVVFLAGWLVAAVAPLADERSAGLDVGGLDVHRYFSAHELSAAHATSASSTRCGRRTSWRTSSRSRYSPVARRASCAHTGLGRVGAGVIVAMLVLVTLWFVSLPFGLRRALVGGAARARAAQLRVVDRRAVELARVRSAVRVRRRRGRARPRRPARRTLVARRRAALRCPLRGFAFLFGFVVQLGDARRQARRCGPTFALLERREGVTARPSTSRT